jgi:hypothetical protein
VVGYGKDSLEKGFGAPKRRFVAAIDRLRKKVNFLAIATQNLPQGLKPSL